MSGCHPRASLTGCSLFPGAGERATECLVCSTYRPCRWCAHVTSAISRKRDHHTPSQDLLADEMSTSIVGMGAAAASRGLGPGPDAATWPPSSDWSRMLDMSAIPCDGGVREPLSTASARAPHACARPLFFGFVRLTVTKISRPSGSSLPSAMGFSAIVGGGTTRVCRSEPGPQPMSRTERTPSARSTSSAHERRCIHSLRVSAKTRPVLRFRWSSAEIRQTTAELVKAHHPPAPVWAPVAHAAA